VTLAGDLQATFTPDPDPGFGIRNAVWHPSGMFLAVGGWDDKVQLRFTYLRVIYVVLSPHQIHILDSLSWSSVTTLELSSRIPAGTVSN
jgi:hypothetical protein